MSDLHPKCVDADSYRNEVDRLRGLLAVASSRLAEIKAICFAADDPRSERYTDDQSGLVHLIADIRNAAEWEAH